MAQTQAKIEDGIARIVMQSREEMMSYFKGTCVDRIVRNNTPNHNLILFQGFTLPSRTNRNYYYERREQEIANPKRLYLFNTGLLEVRHEPDTVTFYPGVMNRSPEFQAIHRQLKDFFGKYLQGVVLREDDKSEYNSANNGREDNALIIGTTEVQPEREYEATIHWDHPMTSLQYNGTEPPRVQLRGPFSQSQVVTWNTDYLDEITEG